MISDGQAATLRSAVARAHYRRVWGSPSVCSLARDLGRRGVEGVALGARNAASEPLLALRLMCWLMRPTSTHLPAMRVSRRTGSRGRRARAQVRPTQAFLNRVGGRGNLRPVPCGEPSRCCSPLLKVMSRTLTPYPGPTTVTDSVSVPCMSAPSSVMEVSAVRGIRYCGSGSTISPSRTGNTRAPGCGFTMRPPTYPVLRPLLSVIRRCHRRGSAASDQLVAARALATFAEETRLDTPPWGRSVRPERLGLRVPVVLHAAGVAPGVLLAVENSGERDAGIVVVVDRPSRSAVASVFPAYGLISCPSFPST